MSMRVSPAPIALDALVTAVEAEVRHRGEGCGAIATFLGVVRATHRGRHVRYLEYEAYDALAIKVFDRIAAEAAEAWPGAALAIQHRVGRLDIGEASVAIAAAAAHRAAAFAVCRYAIERIKQIAPIWKHEFFVDGEAWVEGAVADPADDAARRQAYEIACA
ncbi:MAG TPA: molybdenum cofactor biosynthesis protein MoaE [Vicinamibacterales bacterium]|nr:molybdenum cofactor biosynthesis protein MoaE [Vicinamibacterales bacterium]